MFQISLLEPKPKHLWVFKGFNDSVKQNAYNTVYFAMAWGMGKVVKIKTFEESLDVLFV